jgi:acetyl-CoA C-acetyltransferase
MREPIAAIVGGGRTKFGELWHDNPEQMIIEAGIRALESVDHGIERSEFDACFFSSFLYQVTNKLGLLPGYMSRELGLKIPMSMTEAACGSGGASVYNACKSIESGRFDVVLVGGFEKMSDRQDKIVDDLMFAADSHEFYAGNTFPGLYASMMARYLHDYGDQTGKCREVLAQIACKNHHHAISNPYAQFKREITIDDVLNSPKVADPIRLLHCSPISDGAAAIILTRPELAKEYTDTPVYIVASQQATDDISLYSRNSLTEITTTTITVNNALNEADLTMDDVQLVEVHDCFTIEELLFLEDASCFKKGMSWKSIYESYASFNGAKHIPLLCKGRELIVNSGGGLKADGHPVGATGVRQLVECFTQLAGTAGKHQVELDEELNAALTHNIGGTGAIANVHILMKHLG